MEGRPGGSSSEEASMTQRAPATDWEESFWGGSEEAEERQIAVWARDIVGE